MTEKKKWIWTYSLVFLISFLAVYSLQILNGRGFIYMEANHTGDGLVEHYNSLVYYGEWLRSILHNLFVEHRFSIPTWDLSIGLGGDVVTTLSYYVLGDPLNLLAVFVAPEYTEYLYDFLIIVRLYLAGIAFSVYCRHHQYKDSMILPGAIIYVFSFYTIVVSVLHPYFLNPLIYFPLILLGIDYFFEGKSPFFFIISCAVAALANFYFFYMISMLMAVYVIIRYFAVRDESKTVKKLVLQTGKLILCYFTALFLAMPVLLPSASAILGGNRVSGEAFVPLFYEPVYYLKLLIAFVNASADYYSALGYTSLSVIAVLLLFFQPANERRKKLRIAFLTGTIFLLFPFFGHVLNGFSYVTNRWVWAYCFVVALIVVEMMPQIILSFGKLKWAALLLMVLFAVPTCVFRTGKDAAKLKAMSGVLFVSVFIMIVLFLANSMLKRKREEAVLGIIIIGIFLNAFSFYSPNGGNDLAHHGKNGTAYEARMDSFFRILEENQIDVDDVRIDTANLENFEGVKINSAMMYDMNSTSFSYSVIMGSTNDFLRDMEIPMATDIKYIDMDSRTCLDLFLGCRYMVVEDEKEQYLPYGYDRLAARQEGYAVYENKTVLPAVFWYDSYMMQEEYEPLTAIQKQQVILQTAVMEKEPDMRLSEKNSGDVVLSDRERTPVIKEISDGITLEDGRIVVTGEDAFMTIATERQAGTERYLVFDNLWYEGTGTGCIQVLDGVVNKMFSIKSQKDTMYSDIHDIVCNLGWREQHGEEYTIWFLKEGVYTWDELNVVDMQVEQLEQFCDERRGENMEFSMEEDRVTVHVNEKEPGILSVSFPYSHGWSVWVDGKKAECLKINNFNVGVLVDAGAHEVVFSYHTPYMWVGFLFMVMGFVLCAGLFLLDRHMEKGCQ